MPDPIQPAEDPAAVPGRLIIAWPQARLAVNTPDKLELLMGEQAAGLKSHLMAVQDWYGIGRDEALELIDQIKRDADELARIHPELAAARALPMPPGPAGEESPDDRTGDDDGSGYR
jgi:hypothetical protein